MCHMIPAEYILELTLLLSCGDSCGVTGNKEAHWDGEPTPPQHPSAGSPYEKAQQHRRFQVYVHSKMMIVDDEVHNPSPYISACVSVP